MTTDRRSALLADLDIANSRGLEIGPLTAAVVSKKEGRVEYVDHLSTEELRKKYANETSIDVADIPVIDHVLEDGQLPRHLIGSNYDYIVASHVFEHLPNPLGWLRDCASILRSGGCLGLVVPDKRFTFDLIRPLTTLAELIESDLLDQRKPQPRQIYEAATCSAPIEAGVTWKRAPQQDELPPIGDHVDAFGLLKAEESTKEYIDIHCTVYTRAVDSSRYAESPFLPAQKFSRHAR
jgi:SAM-dependent methyltransferase